MRKSIQTTNEYIKEVSIFLKYILLKNKSEEFFIILKGSLQSKEFSLFKKIKISVLYFNKINSKSYNSFFESLIQKEKSAPLKEVLDLACGYGDFFLFLKNNHPEISYTGIDISNDKSIIWRYLIKSYPEFKINFLNKDILKFVKDPLSNYNLIICLNTIMYFQDYPTFLENIFKNSKKEANFIISFSTPTKPQLSDHKHGPIKITKDLFQKQVIKIGFRIIDSFEFPLSDGTINTYFMKK